MTDILPRVPRGSEFVAFRELDDEMVLMNLQTLLTYALNETAAIIWKYIDGQSTVGEIIGKISLEYDIPQEQCKNDIIETIINFKEENLIVF